MRSRSRGGVTQAPTPAASPSSPGKTDAPPITDLSDPKSCLGTGDGTLAVVPDQFSIAPNGSKELVICDLSGKGLSPQVNEIAQVLKAADCDPDPSGPTRGYVLPADSLVTLGYPVKGSDCLNNFRDTLTTPKPQTSATA